MLLPKASRSKLNFSVSSPLNGYFNFSCYFSCLEVTLVLVEVSSNPQTVGLSCFVLRHSLAYESALFRLPEFRGSWLVI